MRFEGAGGFLRRLRNMPGKIGAPARESSPDFQSTLGRSGITIPGLTTSVTGEDLIKRANMMGSQKS